MTWFFFIGLSILLASLLLVAILFLFVAFSAPFFYALVTGKFKPDHGPPIRIKERPLYFLGIIFAGLIIIWSMISGLALFYVKVISPLL